MSELPHVGERRLRFVQEHARATQLPLASVLHLPARRLAAEYRLPAAAMARLRDEGFWHHSRCTLLAERLGAAGVRIVQPEDAAFPAGWRRWVPPPPPLLYAYGAADLARRPSVALLNSRLVCDRTTATTLRLVRVAAEARLALAGGGMKTLYRLANHAARTMGMARLIVLDRGLLNAFGGRLDHDPFGIGPRRGTFDAGRTLVLSPFRPDDHALPRSARRRDELVAGLASLVVVVSARPGGEIEALALRLLQRGRRILLWRGGNAALMAAGAQFLGDDDLDRGLRRLLPADGTDA